MRYSENYGLYLPEGSDFVSPEQFNDNFTTLDRKLKVVEDKANSHKHGIAELTGVAAEGHKHSAGDIASGVLAKERVPYKTDAEHYDAFFRVTDLSQAVSCEKSQRNTYSFKIPFPVTQTERPARVLTRVGPNWGNWSLGRPSSSIPQFAVLDMAYGDDGIVGSISGVFRGSWTWANDYSENIWNWVKLPLIGSEWRNEEIISYSGGTTSGYADWTGFCGNAFFKSTIKPAESSSYFGFNIGNISYDRTGIVLEIKSNAHPLNNVTQVGTLTFRADIFIFN